MILADTGILRIGVTGIPGNSIGSSGAIFLNESVFIDTQSTQAIFTNYRRSTFFNNANCTVGTNILGASLAGFSGSPESSDGHPYVQARLPINIKVSITSSV